MLHEIIHANCVRPKGRYNWAEQLHACDGKHVVIINNVIFHVNNEMFKGNHYLTRVIII